MQATGTLRETRSSKGFIVFVVVMLCALLLGGAGGYLARSGSQAAGGAVHVQPIVVHGNLANQGGPDSDRTRALPTSAPANPAAGFDTSDWTGSNAAQPDHGLIP